MWQSIISVSEIIVEKKNNFKKSISRLIIKREYNQHEFYSNIGNSELGKKAYQCLSEMSLNLFNITFEEEHKNIWNDVLEEAIKSTLEKYKELNELITSESRKEHLNKQLGYFEKIKIKGKDYKLADLFLPLEAYYLEDSTKKEEDTNVIKALKSWFNQSENNILHIVGQSGYGKSILVKKIVYELAKNGNYIPFYISFKNIAMFEKGTNYKDRILKYLKEFEAFFDMALLEKESVVLVIDGLDDYDIENFDAEIKLFFSSLLNFGLMTSHKVRWIISYNEDTIMDEHQFECVLRLKGLSKELCKKLWKKLCNVLRCKLSYSIVESLVDKYRLTNPLFLFHAYIVLKESDDKKGLNEELLLKEILASIFSANYDEENTKLKQEETYREWVSDLKIIAACQIIYSDSQDRIEKWNQYAATFNDGNLRYKKNRIADGYVLKMRKIIKKNSISLFPEHFINFLISEEILRIMHKMVLLLLEAKKSINIELEGYGYNQSLQKRDYLKDKSSIKLMESFMEVYSVESIYNNKDLIMCINHKIEALEPQEFENIRMSVSAIIINYISGDLNNKNKRCPHLIEMLLNTVLFLSNSEKPVVDFGAITNNKIDLIWMTQVQLSNIKFKNLDINKNIVRNIVLFNSELDEVNYKFEDLSKIDNGPLLYNVYLCNIDIKDSNYTCIINKVKAESIYLYNVKFYKCRIEYSCLKNINFHSCRFSQCEIASCYAELNFSDCSFTYDEGTKEENVYGVYKITQDIENIKLMPSNLERIQ